ncbi:MAG: hypothetical protein FWD15_04630 [Alphaproteobacteria bacterium]|nr:hypothetical protein [Alphaproteobacteria bacterium]
MALADKIKLLLDPIAVSKDARIVAVEYGGKVLRALVEALDYSPLPMKKIEELSRLFSATLDVEDVIKDRYYLEVSSPGMARPILTREDWNHFAGRMATVELREPNAEGLKTLNMKITPDFDFSEVAKAKLFISDMDIKNILKERKKNG